MKYKLSAVIEIIGGGTPKRTEPSYWGGEIPWLSVADFNSENRFVSTAAESITELGLKKSSTKILKAGQIIISARGTVGCLAQLKCDMAFNQSCYGISGLKKYLINDYLYYLLKSKITELKQKTHGAVFDTITRETFNHIDVLLPSIEKQRIISDTLGAFDKKIELNQKTNQTLEAMAQALFKSWFVDFEPVKAKIAAKAAGADAEGMTLAAMEALSGQNAEALAKMAQTEPDRYAELKATAELFPDALVDSELGAIPVGWEVSSLGQLIKVQHGFAFKGEQFTDQPTGFYVMTPGNFKIGGGFQAGKPKFLTGTPPDDYILQQEDLVITMTDLSKQGDTLGYPAIIPFHPSYKFLHNQRLGRVEFLTSTPYTYFMYCFLCSTQYRHEIVSGATGSTVKHTSPSKIQSSKLPFSEEISNSFNLRIAPFFQQIQKLEEEIYSLGSIRDTLLPKLLSGEISVENIAEAAMA